MVLNREICIYDKFNEKLVAKISLPNILLRDLNSIFGYSIDIHYLDCYELTGNQFYELLDISNLRNLLIFNEDRYSYFLESEKG